MVKTNSTARLFSLKTQVILTQTDTTVGFLSQNEKKLQKIKQRPSTKPFIIVYKNLKTIKLNGIRVPNKYKQKLRRATKTSFIIKNRAFRVSETQLSSQILKKSLWNFSTSANESSKNFKRDFCEQKADIIIEDKNFLYEDTASILYKINNKTLKRLR